MHTLTSLLLLPALVSAVTIDCEHIQVSGQSFNLGKLAGPKTIHHTTFESPSIHNTTFTLDICAPLKKSTDAKKGEDCPTGTWVCGKKYIYHPNESADGVLDEVIPIAGQYTFSHGRTMDPKYTRLKDSDSNTDANLEGLRIELHGGSHSDVDQKAIIEFKCDKEWTGLEGFEDSKESRRSVKRDESDQDSDPELPDLDKGKALQFLSYKQEKDVGVLRMEWKTDRACEDAINEKDPEDVSQGWGFFTWFLIIAFLLAAAYIIFGSWLNYNRYGARGWDLVPHGDTIRDIPYIVKDWAGNLTDKLRGDSRGGYSAV